MTEPTATRPYMPGYGVQPATAGRGLLPWSWAEQRLIRAHDYWLATVTPDGAPHLMPVWAVWHTGALWFSSSNGSPKARNLAGRAPGVGVRARLPGLHRLPYPVHVRSRAGLTRSQRAAGSGPGGPSAPGPLPSPPPG